ncbi:MAG: cohesin domain-containing protein [Methylococcaceae bacterium]|nr:cohesin domain-containing protein [Methylococcaceae bacterium]
MKKQKIFKLILLLLSLNTSSVYAALLSVDLIPGRNVDNTLSANVGSSFNVEIVLNDVTDFAGFEFDLDFDSNVLTATAISSGYTFGLDTFLLDDTISAGNLSFSETSLATNGLDINTPIVIATISFDAIEMGASDLNLSNVILSDSLGIEQSPVTLTHGNTTISAVPVPAAFWLFFSGILSIGIRRNNLRRRTDIN